MKSLVCTQPGSFEYKEATRPGPAPGEAIIRIRRIGICGTDLHAFEGTQPFLDYPRILGHELSGEIVNIDDDSEFRIGEVVTFVPYFSCGTCIACRRGKPNCCTTIRVSGVHQDGGFVEYLRVPAGSLIHGAGLSFDELALVEPLAIGAHAIRRAAIDKDEFVLVVGAGPIGLGTMEFARIAGGRVIALDINPTRLEFCKNQLNIPYSVNAATDGVTDKLKEFTGGDMPTTVIDATGNLGAINKNFEYMAHGGKYILVGLQKGMISFSHPEFHKREATLMSSRNATKTDFDQVVACLKSGLISPANYITHRASFEEAAGQFPAWLDPAGRVIKAMVTID